MIVTSTTAGSTQPDGAGVGGATPAPEQRDRKRDRERDRDPGERIDAAPRRRRARTAWRAYSALTARQASSSASSGVLLARHGRADRELEPLRRSPGRSARPAARGRRTSISPKRAVPLVLAEDREVAIDAPAHRQMAGGFADPRGVRRRLDVADELDRGALPRRVAREHHPDPAAGAGRSRAGVGLRNRRDVPLRELRGRQPACRSRNCQLPPRNIATSPAMAAPVSCW